MDYAVNKWESEVDYEIVVVGAGICGIATALALHRKHMKCVVFERAETLRGTVGAIGIMRNGWLALDQLGVASNLRHTAFPIIGSQDIWLDTNKKKVMPFTSAEARCLRRSDLIHAMYDSLPPDTVKFGKKIVSVKLDPKTAYPVLQLEDGSSVVAKVLIGCDGGNSVVARFLELKPAKRFTRCSIRGLTKYPNGQPFTHEFFRMRRNNVLVGRIPMDNTLVYWFLAFEWKKTDDMMPKEPDLIMQLSLESVEGFSSDVVEMIKNTDPDSLSFTPLRYRAPWDLLLGKFRKGTVTVAGDAMHVMGPFLGQGGSAGLEDAVVLARSLARKLKNSQTELRSIGEAIDDYVKERRLRIVRLATETYLVGLLLREESSSLMKFFVIMLMIIFFRNNIGHTKYDCGTL